MGRAYRDLITRTFELRDRSSSGLRVHLDLTASSRELVDGTYGDAPLTGVLGSPGPDRDLVGTYRVGPYLVSDRFLDVLRGENLQGWRATECHVSVLSGIRLHLLQALGRAGPLWVWTGSGGDPDESDPDPGDGFDFFLSGDSSQIYLSEVAASRLTAARLRNVLIEPADVVFLPR